MRIPNFKDLDVTKFLTEWDREIERLRKDSMSNVTGNRAVLLLSPSLKVYEIKVDDAGVISSTLVQG